MRTINICKYAIFICALTTYHRLRVFYTIRQNEELEFGIDGSPSITGNSSINNFLIQALSILYLLDTHKRNPKHTCPCVINYVTESPLGVNGLTTNMRKLYFIPLCNAQNLTWQINKYHSYVNKFQRFILNQNINAEP